MQLFRGEITDRLLSVADASYRIKGSKLCQYPDEEDFNTLKVYLLQHMTRLMRELRDGCDAQTAQSWHELLEQLIKYLCSMQGVEPRLLS